MVSDLQEAVDSVGPAKIAQAEAKAIREIKRDIEATLCSNNEMTVENGAGTAYGFRGLGKWIQNGAQVTNPVPEEYRTPSASIKDQGGTAITEAEFNDLITSIYRKTGTTDSLTLVADTALRRTISDFARIGAGANDVREFNLNGESGSIKLSVELYQSDHGIVSIINGNPDCMPTTDPVNETGYLLNPEFAGIHELIPLGSTRLPNLGGGERGYVDCSLTLGVYHPQAHGKITD